MNIKKWIPQILAAVAVSLGSMVIGFSSAYTSPALFSMQNDKNIHVTNKEASWVGGVSPLSAVAGGVTGGALVDYIGRRRTILFTAPAFVVAWILIATATTVDLVLAGRAVCGFCTGIGSLALPVYLGETMQPEVRGTLGLFPAAIGNIGILICYVAGNYLNWFELAFLGAALPVPFFIVMLMIPETPRWYISNGRIDDARKALLWLREKNANIDDEIRDIEQSDAATEDKDSTLKELFSKKYMKSICISLGLIAFGQLSGFNVLIYFTGVIFHMSNTSVDEKLTIIIAGIVNFASIMQATTLIDRCGRKMLLFMPSVTLTAVIYYSVQTFHVTSVDEKWSSIIVGIVNFASIMQATTLIDRCGRKILLYISSVTMTISLAVLGTFFYANDKLLMNVEAMSWLPLTCLMVYMVGYSMGFGPIPWLMMGEILPAKIRGPAASICTAFNWLCSFAVGKTWYYFLDAFGRTSTFWLFGCICFGSLFFVVICVPETRGKSLEQIETKLTGRIPPRTRSLSSIGNIKPLPFGC